jgi:hypothetical protein
VKSGQRLAIERSVAAGSRTRKQFVEALEQVGSEQLRRLVGHVLHEDGRSSAASSMAASTSSAELSGRESV